MAQNADWLNRWNHVRKILERSSPFAHPDFEPSPDILNFLQNTCNVLIVGAGGLGCELLKDLALMGFRNLHIIDMDTIDLSNLNRQFLFRHKDIGQSKAEVAAAVINNKIPGCNVIPHCNKIQNFGPDFYSQFHIIVCGLDSVVARRWLNGMITSLANDSEDMQDQSIVPLVDGGTEGFKGNARVIIPTQNACVECTLDLYPPQINFPLCTIAHTPRLPEHCIEYVRLLQWLKDNPFGESVEIDGDDPQHIQWIHDKAKERAEEYKIQGVTYRLTQGVIKHIIPAVASTNAVIAAVCAMEVFKIATSCAVPLNNYMVFNDTDGLYTYTFEAEKKDNCLSCSQTCRTLTFSDDTKLQDVFNYLVENAEYQMKAPGITTVLPDGKNKTLYIQSVQSIEEKTRPNLKKTLGELGLTNGQEIVVADVTTPISLMFKLNLASKMEDV